VAGSDRDDADEGVPGAPAGAAGRTPPSRAALAAWLRRAARHQASDAQRILRGSLLIGAYCPGRGRPSNDIDYLMPGDFDAGATAHLVDAIVAVADPQAAPLVLERTELTWAETAFPGLRAHLRAGDAGFHVDFSCGDPLSLPPRRVRLPDLPGLEAQPVLACAAETLFAWKLHGLCEHGLGRWRAKDLYDLDVLWTDAALDRTALRPGVELAFTSRATSLAALDDFRTREGWGASRGGTRKWRSLARQVPDLGDFLAARGRVRAAVDAILGPTPPAPPTPPTA
jgi:hypothetical protein